MSKAELLGIGRFGLSPLDRRPTLRVCAPGEIKYLAGTTGVKATPIVQVSISWRKTGANIRSLFNPTAIFVVMFMRHFVFPFLASLALTIARACSAVRVRLDFLPPLLPILAKYSLISLFIVNSRVIVCFHARQFSQSLNGLVPGFHAKGSLINIGLPGSISW